MLVSGLTTCYLNFEDHMYFEEAIEAFNKDCEYHLSGYLTYDFVKGKGRNPLRIEKEDVRQSIQTGMQRMKVVELKIGDRIGGEVVEFVKKVMIKKELRIVLLKVKESIDMINILESCIELDQLENFDLTYNKTEKPDIKLEEAIKIFRKKIGIISEFRVESI